MIKIASNNDIEELSKLRVEQQKEDWQELYPNKDEEFYNLTKNYLNDHLNKDIFMFVEILESKIVATCGLQIINYLPQCRENSTKGYLCNVFTLKEYRRRGIQTNLLKNCIDFARKKDVCIISLSSDNEEARSIYKKQGFLKDDLIMKMELKSYE